MSVGESLLLQGTEKELLADAGEASVSEGELERVGTGGKVYEWDVAAVVAVAASESGMRERDGCQFGYADPCMLSAYSAPLAPATMS